MEVIVTKSAGFCFGVRRAVEQVYEQVQKGGKIYTYGPIAHNEEVVRDLEAQGVTVLESREDLAALTEGTVVIRAHGVPEEIYALMEAKGLRYIDATCPFVKRIHKIVQKESADGRQIVIIGNDGHPEVEGIKGWVKTSATVIETSEQARNFTLQQDEKLCIVTQTTFNYKKFQELVEIFQKKGYDSIVANTICSATENSQREARELAAKADAMIVIGGTHSSNTRKLYELCKSECENTYYIQTLEDLKLELPNSVELVGITAGTSTPNKIIEEVQNYVRLNF
ncbi:MAG: 4-hydroxy-3-methylbut-2-enyl diphosphate reductase [Roseburia sp.]|nr:4-hydroxy-3-methylbut-2-enyl diphosphate reductase [Roseburia sp.]